jgi:hypothetical protein
MICPSRSHLEKQVQMQWRTGWYSPQETGLLTTTKAKLPKRSTGPQQPKGQHFKINQVCQREKTAKEPACWRSDLTTEDCKSSITWGLHSWEGKREGPGLADEVTEKLKLWNKNQLSEHSPLRARDNRESMKNKAMFLCLPSHSRW